MDRHTPDELSAGTRRFFLYQRDSRHIPLDDASVDYVIIRQWTREMDKHLVDMERF